MERLISSTRTMQASGSPAEDALPWSERRDGRLLELIVQARSGEAFAEIVRRHGPLVLGVCRRTLGDVPDVDDAFQAVFVVLFRKADTVRPADRLGAWLYGVARKVACKARGLIARRRQREQPLGDYSIDGAPPDPLDWLPLLDRELGLLPEKFRSAIVMCDLEGRSRRDAATRLRLSEGTLSSRLARGRALLGHRLKQRGVALSAALTAFASVSAPSSALASQTTSAVFAGAAGAPGLLSQGVLQAMFVNKIVNILAATLVAISLTLGAGTGAFLAQAADKPAKPANPADPAKPAKPANPNAAEKPAKPNMGEFTQGTVKAIDAAKNSITLQVPNPGTKESKEETLALSKDVKVELAHGLLKESKPGALADVTPGSKIFARLSDDKKSIVAINVQPISLNGGLVSYDPAKRVVTIAMKDTKEKIEKSIEIAEDAKVYIDDGLGNKGDAPKEGKLADLSPGLMISIQLSGYDRAKGVAVRVSGPTVHGSVEGIDIGNNSITIANKSDGSQTYTLSKDVRVGKGKLADVVNGANVSLRLSVTDKKLVVGLFTKE
jgi:RNA polymerase sigma factor (sigma-70 family)